MRAKAVGKQHLTPRLTLSYTGLSDESFRRLECDVIVAAPESCLSLLTTEVKIVRLGAVTIQGCLGIYILAILANPGDIQGGYSDQRKSRLVYLGHT
jgi:hypothetical protein